GSGRDGGGARGGSPALLPAAMPASGTRRPPRHEALAAVAVGWAAGVGVEDAEHLVPARLVELRPGLEAEGVEVRVRTAALARVGLGGLEQPATPSLLAAILVHPEELDVQPRGPDVAEHPAADPAGLVAPEES